MWLSYFLMTFHKVRKPLLDKVEPLCCSYFASGEPNVKLLWKKAWTTQQQRPPFLIALTAFLCKVRRNWKPHENKAFIVWVIITKTEGGLRLEGTLSVSFLTYYVLLFSFSFSRFNRDGWASGLLLIIEWSKRIKGSGSEWWSSAHRCQFGCWRRELKTTDQRAALEHELVDIDPCLRRHYRRLYPSTARCYGVRAAAVRRWGLSLL